MHDHQGAVAALLIALGLVAWYAAREHRSRLEAEAERDVFEGELEERAGVRRDNAARIDQARRRTHAAGTTVDLFTSPVIEVPHPRRSPRP